MMKKSFFTKLFTILLFGIIISTTLFAANVEATNVVEATNIKANEANLNYFEDMPIENTENLEAEEKILMYDATTGETTEIDIDSIKQAQAKLYSDENSTEAYNPLSTTSIIRPRTTYSTYNRITNVTTFPSIAICRLKWYVSSTEVGCGSGFLVGKNLLLTNAHCVMNMNDNDSYFTNWLAYPGYMENSSYNNLSTGWSRIIYSSNWKTTHAAEYDWCLCILGDDIGSTVGYMGLRAYTYNSGLQDATVACIGYPTNPGNGEYQYLTYGTIEDVWDGYFAGNFALTNGMSGGPIVEPSDQNKAVGLNRGYTSTQGIGTKITDTILAVVRENS